MVLKLATGVAYLCKYYAKYLCTAIFYLLCILKKTMVHKVATTPLRAGRISWSRLVSSTSTLRVKYVLVELTKTMRTNWGHNQVLVLGIRQEFLGS